MSTLLCHPPLWKEPVFIPTLFSKSRTTTNDKRKSFEISQCKEKTGEVLSTSFYLPIYFDETLSRVFGISSQYRNKNQGVLKRGSRILKIYAN